MKNFISNHFSKIDDPRSYRNQLHDFTTLIGTTFCAALSGIDSFSGMQDYTESHFEELSKYFDFPNGVPRHDTYQRLWDSIDPQQFCKSFKEFTESLQKMIGEVISIDGKTMRNSGKEKPLHVVSAWCKANQLVLGQEKVDSKSNEITAIPKLLEILDIKGMIITIDAMGAQRNICEQIVKKEGDYVIALKGNQGNLYEDVVQYFSDPEILDSLLIHEENDKGHGRIEQRIAYVTDQIDWLQDMHKWPGLKSIGMVKTNINPVRK